MGSRSCRQLPQDVWLRLWVLGLPKDQAKQDWPHVCLANCGGGVLPLVMSWGQSVALPGGPVHWLDWNCSWE